jgi:hypothetical protein
MTLLRMKLHMLLALSLGSVACSGDRAPAPLESTSAPAATTSAIPTSAPVADEAGAPGADGGGPLDANEPQTGDPGLTGYGGIPGGPGSGLLLLDSAGHRTRIPGLQVQTGVVSISGRIQSEIVERGLRERYGGFRVCYEQARSRNPSVQGRVQVRFTIGNDGVVTKAAIDPSLTDVLDPAMLACVRKGFDHLTFPNPEGGVSLVGVPLTFALPPPVVVGSP